MFFGSLKHMVVEARWDTLQSGVLDAWPSGRDSAPLLPVYWEHRWEQPMEVARESLGLRALAGPGRGA